MEKLVYSSASGKPIIRKCNALGCIINERDLTDEEFLQYQPQIKELFRRLKEHELPYSVCL